MNQHNNEKNPDKKEQQPKKVSPEDEKERDFDTEEIKKQVDEKTDDVVNDAEEVKKNAKETADDNTYEDIEEVILSAREARDDANKDIDNVAEPEKTASVEDLEKLKEARKEILDKLKKGFELIKNIPESKRGKEYDWVVESVERALSSIGEDGKHKVSVGENSQKEGIPVDGIISILESIKKSNKGYDEILTKQREVLDKWSKEGASDVDSEHQEKMAWHEVYNDLSADEQAEVDQLRKHWADEEQLEEYADPEQFSLQTGEALKQIVDKKSTAYNQADGMSKFLSENSIGYSEVHSGYPDWRTELEAAFISLDYRSTDNAEDNYRLAMETMLKRRELVLPDLAIEIEEDEIEQHILAEREAIAAAKKAEAPEEEDTEKGIDIKDLEKDTLILQLTKEGLSPKEAKDRAELLLNKNEFKKSPEFDDLSNAIIEGLIDNKDVDIESLKENNPGLAKWLENFDSDVIDRVIANQRAQLDAMAHQVEAIQGDTRWKRFWNGVKKKMPSLAFNVGTPIAVGLVLANPVGWGAAGVVGGIALTRMGCNILTNYRRNNKIQKEADKLRALLKQEMASEEDPAKGGFTESVKDNISLSLRQGERSRIKGRQNQSEDQINPENDLNDAMEFLSERFPDMSEPEMKEHAARMALLTNMARKNNALEDNITKSREKSGLLKFLAENQFTKFIGDRSTKQQVASAAVYGFAGYIAREVPIIRNVLFGYAGYKGGAAAASYAEGKIFKAKSAGEYSAATSMEKEEANLLRQQILYYPEDKRGDLEYQKLIEVLQQYEVYSINRRGLGKDASEPAMAGEEIEVDFDTDPKEMSDEELVQSISAAYDRLISSMQVKQDDYPGVVNFQNDREEFSNAVAAGNISKTKKLIQKFESIKELIRNVEGIKEAKRTESSEVDDAEKEKAEQEKDINALDDLNKWLKEENENFEAIKSDREKKETLNKMSHIGFRAGGAALGAIGGTKLLGFIREVSAGPDAANIQADMEAAGITSDNVKEFFGQGAEITPDNAIKIDLGAEGGPVYLERALNSLSLSEMRPEIIDQLREDGGLLNELNGSKMLNISANLRVLMEGGSVAGLKPEDLGDTISFENNVLTITDSDKFSEIASKLWQHADSRITDSNITNMGATAYLDNYSNNTWEKMLEVSRADGGQELAAMDFNHSPIVRAAEINLFNGEAERLANQLGLEGDISSICGNESNGSITIGENNIVIENGVVININGEQCEFATDDTEAISSFISKSVEPVLEGADKTAADINTHLGTEFFKSDVLKELKWLGYGDPTLLDTGFVKFEKGDITLTINENGSIGFTGGPDVFGQETLAVPDKLNGNISGALRYYEGVVTQRNLISEQLDEIRRAVGADIELHNVDTDIEQGVMALTVEDVMNSNKNQFLNTLQDNCKNDAVGAAAAANMQEHLKTVLTDAVGNGASIEPDATIQDALAEAAKAESAAAVIGSPDLSIIDARAERIQTDFLRRLTQASVVDKGYDFNLDRLNAGNDVGKLSASKFIDPNIDSHKMGVMGDGKESFNNIRELITKTAISRGIDSGSMNVAELMNTIKDYKPDAGNLDQAA